MNAAELHALLPLLLLALGATGLLLGSAWAPQSQAPLSIGALLALGAALCAGLYAPAVASAGGMVATDPFGRGCVILFSTFAGLTLLLSRRYAAERAFDAGIYAGLVLFCAAGMAFLAAATSLVGLFAGLESLSLALYILIAFDRSRPQSGEAGIKYLLLGMTAGGVLAFGIGLIYLGCGSFTLTAAVATLSGAGPLPGIALFGWALLVAAAAFKLSFVPFHLWTADVYQGAPLPVSGFLAAGSKGAVALVLARIATTFHPGWGILTPLLLTLAALTLLAGPLAALAQRSNVKRLLAWSSVAHMGFLLVPLAVGGKGSGTAVGFYVVVYALATLGAFGILALLSAPDRELDHFDALRGLGYRRPWYGLGLVLCLFSLAGIPGTGGFLGKFQVLLIALRGGAVGLVLFAIVAAVISAAYYLRLILTLYMAGEHHPLGEGDAPAAGAILLCILGLLFLGLYPTPLLQLLARLLP